MKLVGLCHCESNKARPERRVKAITRISRDEERVGGKKRPRRHEKNRKRNPGVEALADQEAGQGGNKDGKRVC